MNAPSRILSPEEVTALLAAVDRGDLADAGVGGDSVIRGARVATYDFRKPNRFSKDHVKMLQSIHETFARLYTSSLSTLVRGYVEVELRSVEQLTYGEFLTTLSPPTCLALFNMDPLEGAAAIDVSATVLYVVIDRLLGGSGLMPVRLREFTEVEQVLVERIAMRAMVDLRQAWQHVGTFGFRVDHMETNPQFVQLTAPNEATIVVTLNVKVGEDAGKITIAFPHILLESVMSRLGTHTWFASSARAPSRAEESELQASVLRLAAPLRGILAEVPITVGELLELKVGDVVSLGRPVSSSATVEIGGVPRFTARAGLLNRHKALQILTTIPRGETQRDPEPITRARIVSA
jgi:flagellar motor switch protein FliM